MNELSALANELRKCGETLISISQNLIKTFEEENLKKADKAVAKEKNIRLEDVRSVLAEKSRAGFSKEVKALIGRYGVEKLSDINEADLKDVLAETEAIE